MPLSRDTRNAFFEGKGTRAPIRCPKTKGRLIVVMKGHSWNFSFNGSMSESIAPR